MKLLDIQAAIGTAIILLSVPCDASHDHSANHLHILGKKHSHGRTHPSSRAEHAVHELKKRSNCQFPTNAGLVPVTPGSSNGGWAMSPDQQCIPNSFCPYACPPGQVMAQWNPEAVSYPDPKSMDGGLYCDPSGNIQKPFSNKPLCVAGTGAMGAQNNCGKVVSFCQTVLPGNEAMIIPTEVNSFSQLAVPGPSYWLSTAAHYYISPPGVGSDAACVWGDGSQPLGNWSPYVAGANTDANGVTFSKIGWNPIFLNSPLSSTPPTFGVKIVCSGGGCNGTPCSIDPSTDGMGGVTSSLQASGAGGANFCVVTIPQGSTANVVVFNVGGSAAGSSDEVSQTSAEVNLEEESTTTSTPEPESTTSTSATTTKSRTTSTTSSTTTSSSTSAVFKAVFSPTTTRSTASSSSTSSSSAITYAPHILFEDTKNSSAVANLSTGLGTAFATTTASVVSPSKMSDATAVSGSMFSFLVVFVAAAYIL